MNSSPIGLVLAAGAGRRLGLGPKAHVLLTGENLLFHAVRCLRGAGLAAIRVVGRTDDAAIAPACQKLDVALTLNPQPERGMFSSVRRGIEAMLDQEPSGLILFPVDHPYVRSETVRDLVRALDGHPMNWVRPLFEGRHGHPIALGAGVITRLLQSKETVPLNEALVAAGGVPVDVACDDSGVIRNVNQPEDLVS
jgi:molybdenum cofactor cytidylyltransferase